MLTFFMTPGSCSTGIHILLEALELPFQVTVLNLPAGDHRQPGYLALNPKGKVPGTKMVFNGVKQAGQLADLVAYLKEATK